MNVTSSWLVINQGQRIFDLCMHGGGGREDAVCMRERGKEGRRKGMYNKERKGNRIVACLTFFL